MVTHMSAAEPPDPIDQEILRLLREDARQPAAAIAKEVTLSPAAVRRRIDRLVKAGVIQKYTVVVDHDKVGPSVEAYVELTFDSNADVHAFLVEAVKRPEVREASAITGDPDAMLRLRVRDVDHLRDVVIELRQSGPVTASKTLVALGRLRHVAGRDD